MLDLNFIHEVTGREFSRFWQKGDICRGRRS